MRWDIGIDLGTRNVRMVTEGAQEAFAQPAALAVRAGAAAPLCFGDAALALYGRESEGVEVCFPVSDGTLRNGYVYGANFAARPAFNLKSSIVVSDSTDSDGCYTIESVPGKTGGLYVKNNGVWVQAA